ncbi:MAG: chorismate synthase [Bacteroidales bacterium]|nr:chorismate synthase [Bacteroidales bacterium]MDY0217588.1 chorismate synthase [Bacteroidales bacterium]
MNSFGHHFRISIYGESHGKSIGVIIDGCPPGINLKEEDFFEDLSRRKAGAKGTTTRIEDDVPHITSGIFQGKTTGAPIHIYFLNKNVQSSDYKDIAQTPRPGHADFTAHSKFQGFNDPRGGGHFSGRLTLAIVAAGVIAKKMIPDVKINANLTHVAGSTDINAQIDKALQNGDSVGGIIQCTADHVPVGLGEPFFNSIESQISHLIFSIPAIKGIEFGKGFASADLKGSEMNDKYLEAGITSTNHAGGINGGISNGNQILFRVAVKPTSSISKPQQSFNLKTGEPQTLEIKGRHDACIALRMPVIIEACCAIVLADFHVSKRI